jgi:hypothetical protein
MLMYKAVKTKQLCVAILKSMRNFLPVSCEPSVAEFPLIETKSPIVAPKIIKNKKTDSIEQYTSVATSLTHLISDFVASRSFFVF